jgi:hypothetical protein
MAPAVTAAQPHHTEAKPWGMSQARSPAAARFRAPNRVTPRSPESSGGMHVATMYPATTIIAPGTWTW